MLKLTPMVDSPHPVVRWADGADRAAFAEVVRRTRHAFYHTLLSYEQIDGISDGLVAVKKAWDDQSGEELGLLVAVVDGMVVGGADLVLLEQGDAELTTFYVLPEYQGQGLGVALWEAILLFLRARGISALQVWTATEAYWSRSFYERRGCALFGEGAAIFNSIYAVPHVGYRLIL